MTDRFLATQASKIPINDRRWAIMIQDEPGLYKLWTIVQIHPSIYSSTYQDEPGCPEVSPRPHNELFQPVQPLQERNAISHYHNRALRRFFYLEQHASTTESTIVGCKKRQRNLKDTGKLLNWKLPLKIGKLLRNDPAKRSLRELLGLRGRWLGPWTCL